MAEWEWMSEEFDAIVVGAGAAGLFCAALAGQRGRRVAVLEHGAEIGRKLLISGGGRANFTNLGARAENFLSANPHFAKSALARFGPRDFVALVERHGIAYHEKSRGQLFCNGPARDLLAMLERECSACGVRIVTSCGAMKVGPSTSGFSVQSAVGTFAAPSLAIATGGLSIPKMGATSFGHEIARQFGLTVTECRPALVPLRFAVADRERFTSLAGVSTEVSARTASSPVFRDQLLFTHRGLSGPAILQVSSYWRAGRPVGIDLAPEVDFVAELAACRASGSRADARTVLAAHLPRRLAERWCEIHAVARLPLQMTNREMEAIDAALHRWNVVPAGTEGFEKAEVTAGGVDTADLDSKTMQARAVPGLFFIGEVVDVTGQLGGFNFQWAWSSAAAAAAAL
jgi:predicted Rossmann fold flavoprotein